MQSYFFIHLCVYVFYFALDWLSNKTNDILQLSFFFVTLSLHSCEHLHFLFKPFFPLPSSLHCFLKSRLSEAPMLVLNKALVNFTMNIASDYHRTFTDITIANADVN